MSNVPDKDKGFSSSINYSCFTCNAPICFTSTKDPITGKAIRLNLSTNEVHRCKPEDIGTFKETEAYRNRVAEWLSKQEQKENFASINNSIKDIDAISTNNHTTSKNNDNNGNTNSTNIMALEKIRTSIDHTNAILEQMQIDYKADMAAIKNALKIGTDRMPSAAGEAQA
jgi:hypothetical protein